MPLIVPVPPPNTAQIVFRKNNSISSQIIRWFTYGDWSHAEVTVDAAHGGTIVAAQTAWQAGQTDPGIRNFPIDYDYWSTEQKIFRAKMSPEMYRDFVDYLFDQCGKPFDNLAFLGLVLHNLNMTEQGALYCSMLIEAALQKVKFHARLLGIPDNGVTPQVLYETVAPDPRWVEYQQSPA